MGLSKQIKSALLILLLIPGLCLADSARNKNDQVSDTWIQAKLVTTYTLNRNLSIFDLDVDVKDQVAYLNGVVDSDIKKDLAGEIAKSVEGVKSVENKIEVDESKAKMARADRTSSQDRSFGQVIEDLTTTASIKSKLLADSNVSGFAINVDTENSNVTLSGTVKSDAERELIEKLASNTSGVKDVTNRVQVKNDRS
ncbi:MAG: BON domain-containing protein [Bdellovibrionales bacterium]|nr:BON domain-containing protein [Bdellovibrionales bacterium]